jgi:phosphoglycerate dehydrogenase-like enzyme
MRIAILDDYQNVALSMAPWKRLPKSARIEVFNDTVADKEVLAARLADFEIVCAMRERTPFPASLLARLPNLKLLVTTGMVNASIDLKAAAEHGVTVSGTPGTGHPTSELTFALILDLARGLHGEIRSMAIGGWQSGLGRDLKGARLGIVGLGRQGSRVARYAKAFGMEVVAWSKNLTDEDAARKRVRRVTKSELFKTSDFVTIHQKLSDRTRGLVGARELGWMKKTAFLVNTSRGPIVDTEALVAALDGGRIAGAALDVYDVEPLPANDPLRQVPRLLLTPHIGYVSADSYRIFYEGTLDAVEAFLKGKPIRVLTS